MVRIVNLVFAAIVLFFSASSIAAVIYTDRGLWSAAVTGITTETFNSFLVGTPVTSTLMFPSGISGGGSNAQIHDFGFSSIGQGNSLRTSSNLTILLPGAPRAFGFDYADITRDSVTVSFGSFSHSLALTGELFPNITPDDFAFFGVIFSESELPSTPVITTHYANPNSPDAFHIDNLSFSSAVSVPEPGTLALLSLSLVGLVKLRTGKRNG